MNEAIYFIILGVVMVVAFLLGKFVFPKLNSKYNNLTNLYPELMNWAKSFCEFAAKYISDMIGEDKNKWVADQIIMIADKVGHLELSEDQARSIAQSAYNEFIKGTEDTNKIEESKDQVE